MKRFLATALFPLVIACSTDASNARPSDPPLLPDAGSTEAGPQPRSESCLALDAKLQAALDDGIATIKTSDGVVAVITPECGYSEYFSGKSGLTGENLFRIGSNTKTYVAGVILKLVTDGKLKLTDVLETYVAGIKNGTSITIKQLLNHSSGIFNYTDDPGLDFHAKVTPASLVDLAKKHEPYFEPGAGWHYSNTNFILLGMIAEQVGGKPIAAQIREKILVPYKLEHTFFDGTEPVTGTIAKGFSSTGKDITTSYDMSWAWAAGAMVATPSDLARWITMVSKGEVYTPEIQKELLTGIPAFAGVEYGLGLFLFSAEATGKSASIGHGGDIFGCHSQDSYFPKTDMTVVTITNKDGTSPNDLSIAVFDVLMP